MQKKNTSLYEFHDEWQKRIKQYKVITKCLEDYFNSNSRLDGKPSPKELLQLFKNNPQYSEDYSWALLVSKIKSHRLYNQFKAADNRKITREDASNKLELKFEKDGYKFRVRMWVDENNQLTATISGLYKTDTMCKSFQQDLFFNRNYYVGEDAVTGITREMIKVAYQSMKDEL